MRLIGMLDSPYVRRAAICMECLGVPFEHESVSVFSTFEQFQGINPVVKAPTLVCDDGEVIMDSTLIIQYVERTFADGQSLWPDDPAEFQHDVRAVSLALAACEKSVQIIYERNLRPAAARFEPWLERVRGQLLAAYGALEAEVGKRPAAFTRLGNAGITTAVAWEFTQSMLDGVVSPAAHPGLAALSEHLEATPAFAKYPPDGPGVPSGV